MLNHLKQIYQYRYYIRAKAIADRASSVAGYIFGNFWFLLGPILEIFVYFILIVVIFERGRFENVPSFLGIMTGLIHFWFFMRVSRECLGSIVANRTIMLQIKMEPIVFIATNFYSGLLNVLYYIPIYIVAIIGFKHTFDAQILYYPFVLLILLLATWSVSLLGACCFVFLRDIRNGLPLVLRLLLYMCPVIYPLSWVPARYLDIYLWNPFACMMALVQSTLLGFDMPPAKYILSMAVFFVLLTWIAHFVYERTHRRFTKVF